MNRLLAIVARNPTDFALSLRGARSPSIPSSALRWSVAVCERGDGVWSLWRSDDESDTSYGFLAGAPDGLVLIGSGASIQTAPLPRPQQQRLCRRDRWVFSYDGRVEDTAYLLRRTSDERRAIHDDSDAQRLLAFLLTRLDAVDEDEDDLIDDAVAAAATEISRRIGSLSFLLSDGRSLYAYRFDRALYIAERAAPAQLLIASEPMTSSERWTAVDDRTLLRARRLCPSGKNVTIDRKILLGDDARRCEAVERDDTEPELPFTD